MAESGDESPHSKNGRTISRRSRIEKGIMNMRNRRHLQWVLAAAVILVGASAMAADSAAVDKAFSALATFDWGQDLAKLRPIDKAVIASHGDAAARKALETRLVAVLKTDAPRCAKDYVCRKLMIIGTAESVPTLAGLLTDKELSHPARYALERIPGPEAAQALRDALPKTSGALKIGIVGSLGARGDAASVPALAELLGETDINVARAAATAIGHIGTSEAAKSLTQWLKSTPDGKKLDLREAVVDASLICADRCLANGQKADATLIYEAIRREFYWHVRLAAMRCRLAACDSVEKRVEMAIELVRHNNPQMRAVGLEEVRERAKGAEITRRFAELLFDRAPEFQIDILAALAERGDIAARPAVLEMLKNDNVLVRTAAVQALASLGNQDDVPMLAHVLATAAGPEKAAAKISLTDLSRRAEVNRAIVAQWRQAKPEARAELVEVLLARRAMDSVPEILAATEDPNAAVRMAAMVALGKMAGTEHLEGMLKGVLKAQPGAEREAAEKAVMFVCRNNENVAERAAPLLAAWAKFDRDGQTALFPTLGRVGGPAVLKIIAEAIADQDAPRHSAGIRALCNWPDASAAGKLLELSQSGTDAAERLAALRALIRVAALPDKRSNTKRLELLKKAFALATRVEEQNLVLRRVQAVRTIESLRFVVPYLDQPEHAQAACATVVGLAHHRELREPNKAEFDKALDVVIRIGKDPGMVDRAKRYKKGQT
jgi:HEAT repeat protein